jgi:hypothetical protein
MLSAQMRRPSYVELFPMNEEKYALLVIDKPVDGKIIPSISNGPQLLNEASSALPWTDSKG